MQLVTQCDTEHTVEGFISELWQVCIIQCQFGVEVGVYYTAPVLSSTSDPSDFITQKLSVVLYSQTRHHTLARTHTGTMANVCTHPHTRTYAQTHGHTDARTHARTHTCMHARTHAHADTCTDAWTHRRTDELLGVKLGFPRSCCRAIVSDVLCVRSYVHFVCVCVYMCMCGCVRT